MSVSQFLSSASRGILKFADPEGYDAWIVEVDERGAVEKNTSQPLEGSLNWFTAKSYRPKRPRGTLHLLLHQWTTHETIGSGLPFKDFESLCKVVDQLGLPQCYPYDFGGGQPIPARMNILGNSLDIVCHTPRFIGAWASLALSYDFKTRKTSCFLAVTEGELSQMLDVVRSLKSLASHPLLLPIALYWACSQSLRRDIEGVHRKMKEVQVNTGLLRRYLKVDSKRVYATEAGDAKAESHRRIPTLTEIQEMILEQHALLTRGFAEFTEELGQSCGSALSEIESLGGKDRTGMSVMPDWLDQDAHLELRKLLTHVEVSTKYELRHREQQLSRVGVQLQVLYNLMQSRIGDETLRDSSAMKSIAVMTMVFLPSTALATIFSMGAFFDRAATGPQIVVSKDFWIFWAIAIPLTLLVLTCYFLWVQRAWLQELWRGDDLRDVEAQEESQLLAINRGVMSVVPSSYTTGPSSTGRPPQYQFQHSMLPDFSPRHTSTDQPLTRVPNRS